VSPSIFSSHKIRAVFTLDFTHIELIIQPFYHINRNKMGYFFPNFDHTKIPLRGVLIPDRNKTTLSFFLPLPGGGQDGNMVIGCARASSSNAAKRACRHENVTKVCSAS
jgi:hypothetical protein